MSETMSALREDQKDFARRLMLMKHEAGELELWQTMHRIDDATRMVGFEIAGDADGCREYEAASERERGV